MPERVGDENSHMVEVLLHHAPRRHCRTSQAQPAAHVGGRGIERNCISVGDYPERLQEVLGCRPGADLLSNVGEDHVRVRAAGD